MVCFRGAIKVDGKTIIPIAKVAFGAGAGTGPVVGEEKTGAPSTEAKGEGGGVGAYAAPVGVVEVSDKETKFVPISLKKKLTIAGAVGAALGMVFGLLLGRSRRPRA